MDVNELQRIQSIDDVVEQRLRIAVDDVVRGRHRRDADAGTAAADFGGDGLGNLQHQPRAIFDRTAIGVGALVGAVLGELIEQVAVRAVNLDAVKTGFDGVGGCALEVVDDTGDFAQFERARRGHIGEGAADKGFGFGLNGRWRDRYAVIRLQRGVRNPADMPELDVDVAAALMNAIGDLAPARDLLLGVDAGRVLIALALLRDLTRFGDQQAGGGTLAVIFDGKRIGYEACHGTVARQWCHHGAIGQSNGTELVWLEKFGRRHG